MNILNDQDIKNEKPLEPFIDHLEDENVISYGLGSFGYDIRLAKEYKVLDVTGNHMSHNPLKWVLDPGSSYMSEMFREETGDSCIIPPNSFCLGRSVETFDMPDDIIGIALGKSTYARLGINVNITPIEPSWRGQLTIEISNDTPLPVIIYGGQGIAQILFFRGKRPSTTYDDREGKYQDQEGVSVAKVKGGRNDE